MDKQTGKKLNSRDRRVLLLLALGIAAAVAAAVAVYLYLSPQRATVYVFNDSYKAGTTVTSDMLLSVKCDSTIVYAGANADASNVFVTGDTISYVISTGDSLRIDVDEGMPLTTAMLSVNGGTAIEMNMDPASVAVSVPMSGTRGVTDDLKEGDRVNVYFTGGNTAGTTLLFQTMKILGIARDGNGGIEAVTLECTTDESLTLVYAAENGSLYLGLVDGSGYQYVTGQPSYAPAAQ